MAMSAESLDVLPSPLDRHVIHDGRQIPVPAGWALLPPGDAALTRRIKKDGPTWVMKEKKGRKMFSRGLWAPAQRIEYFRRQLEVERADPAYQKKLDAGRRRREQEYQEYRDEFNSEVFIFLNFAPSYARLASKMADLITEHATPVGSGTVARTKMIPIEKRAEAAVIAWMRHQTTAYDHMHIPREKGKRREVRRMLAQRSRTILEKYRSGAEVDTASCPLAQAMIKSD